MCPCMVFPKCCKCVKWNYWIFLSLDISFSILFNLTEKSIRKRKWWHQLLNVPHKAPASTSQSLSHFHFQSFNEIAQSHQLVASINRTGWTDCFQASLQKTRSRIDYANSVGKSRIFRWAGRSHLMYCPSMSLEKCNSYLQVTVLLIIFCFLDTMYTARTVLLNGIQAWIALHTVNMVICNSAMV